MPTERYVAGLHWTTLDGHTRYRPFMAHSQDQANANAARWASNHLTQRTSRQLVSEGLKTS